MLSGALVSGRIFQKRWAVEGAKQGARFQMRLYLYKRGDCFFISSFLAGKEANGAVAVDKPGQKIERGKTGAPGQGEEEDEKDRPESSAATGCLLSTFDGARQRWKSTEENTRGRKCDKGIKMGRTGQRAQPARAALLKMLVDGVPFLAGFGAEMGCRRCGIK